MRCALLFSVLLFLMHASSALAYRRADPRLEHEHHAAISAGAVVPFDGPAQWLFDFRLRYLDTIGLVLAAHGPPSDIGLSVGGELRPLFIFRTFQNLSTESLWLDTLIDSLALEMGVRWFGDASLDHPTWYYGVGFECPLWFKNPGYGLLALRVSLQGQVFTDPAVGKTQSSEIALFTLSYAFGFGSGLSRLERPVDALPGAP